MIYQLQLLCFRGSWLSKYKQKTNKLTFNFPLQRDLLHYNPQTLFVCNSQFDQVRKVTPNPDDHWSGR